MNDPGLRMPLENPYDLFPDFFALYNALSPPAHHPPGLT